MNKTRFETLPERVIQKILEFFQTEKIIKVDKNLTEYDLYQFINRRRKNLIEGTGIKTDLKTVINFSGVCRHFNNIIKKSDIGKLILTIYYNSDDLKIANKLQHISYCHKVDCKNICHYVNTDIKHSNIIKKIVINKFNEKKKTNHIEDLVQIFGYYLTDKQIESYYKIKKNATKLNETSKPCKSKQLDPFSIYSDSDA